jgi:hypothetical protein
MTSRLFRPEHIELVKCHQKGPRKLRKKYGPFSGIFLEESLAPEHFANHALFLFGYTSAFEELWRKPNLHWVTCQSTAFDGTAKKVVIGLHAEHNNESLIILNNPFARVAQNAMRAWEEKQSVDILVHHHASGNRTFIQVPNPSACDDHIQLPIVLTYEDSLNHAHCAHSLLQQSPDCINGMQTAYAMAPGLGISEMGALRETAGSSCASHPH